MEHLKLRDSVLNCPICSNSGARRQSHYSKHYMKEFNRRIHKYNPVTPEPSYEDFIKTRNILQNYISYKDEREQAYRKSLMGGVIKDSKKYSHQKKEKHFTNIPAIIYQVYTLATDNNKPKKKSSTIYRYPYSSSSSESSTSFIGKTKKKKSTTIQPYAITNTYPNPTTKKPSDDEDTDSEFNTCKKFPITEKHYRHILGGIECSSHHKKQSSFSRKPPKEQEKMRVTKRANANFNQSPSKQSCPRNSHDVCEMKAKKKCNCKSKCKQSLEEETSDSVLSEKTFAKFINSLHSYVNKTKKMNNHKYQKKIKDSDSSCTLCQREEKQMKKKKSSREKERDAKKNQCHHHHHNHHHRRSSHHRAVTEDIDK